MMRAGSFFVCVGGGGHDPSLTTSIYRRPRAKKVWKVTCLFIMYSVLKQFWEVRCLPESGKADAKTQPANEIEPNLRVPFAHTQLIYLGLKISIIGSFLQLDWRFLEFDVDAAIRACVCGWAQSYYYELWTTRMQVTLEGGVWARDWYAHRDTSSMMARIRGLSQTEFAHA